MSEATINFQPQALPNFLSRQFPEKTPIIEGVLYRRDRISLTGRRRHGKTTSLMNIGLAGLMGKKEILGYKIVSPFRTLAFYLEDDGRELQDKLRRMTNGMMPKGFHLYVGDDFADAGIPVDIGNGKFQEFIRRACDAAKPDLTIFDNLGELIGADYTNAPRIHALSQFTRILGKEYDSATLIAAHPRKHNKLDGKTPIRLTEKPEMFFEECMGSSHFINSTGNLWGIERVEEETTICLGAQRMGDGHSFTRVEMDAGGWFHRVKDANVSRQLALTTAKRRQAWDLLPTEFNYLQGEELVRPIMSNASFHALWKELVRHKMIEEDAPAHYRKG